MGYELIAAVDMGSNSFRLQVGRVVDEQIYPLDGFKETVRLAAGLGPDKRLDAASQLRGLAALERFGERLKGFAPGSVRAVATNTLRVAKNAPDFLARGEQALGFPIEVIAGREEARLIYIGVSHSLPPGDQPRMVVDIGGGSTEFIIGRGYEPQLLESLYMGCVSYSLRHFPGGRCDKRGFREAEVAAGCELQTIVADYRAAGWHEVYASSGTAKALAEALLANGLSDGSITLEGLEALRSRLVRAGDVARAGLAGTKPERLPVLAGGLAIMLAVMNEFGIERLAFAEGALRLGVLYDLLGRFHHADPRDATVAQFMRRYHVDARQAERVADTACALFAQLDEQAEGVGESDRQFLDWAARLHEIGISIAHSGYHRHSAYILAHADMPGFSRADQARLSGLVLGHRGKLERLEPLSLAEEDWSLLFCLRLAALLRRSRTDAVGGDIRLQRSAKGYTLTVDDAWLTRSPLTAAALADEARAWGAAGFDYRLKSVRDKVRASG